MCSAHNKGSITTKPSPSSSLGHRSHLPLLFAFFKVLFVVCSVQKGTFNYTNHTYTSSLYQGPEMKGKSCFSQFFSEQQQQKKCSPLGSTDTPNP